MSPVLLFLLAAQAGAAAPPTPTPTPRLNILLSRSSSEAAGPTGSLSDVAKRIKLKLPEGQPRVLTNQTVKQLAEGVQLTTTQGNGGAAYPPAGEAQENPRKAMWQQRYWAAVSRVAELEAEVKRLEGEASRLETDFYAHDDPAQRDGVIKPAWDRAVADLSKAKSDLAEARGKPEEVLNEARRDGALPGWFRGLDQPGAAPPPAPARGGAAPGQKRPTPGRPPPGAARPG
jgi:hypothetical protein